MSESVQEAIAALEEYLRRYPSGHFAELAQVRLDRLLAQAGERKAAIVSSGANPFSKGTLVVDTNYQVGDWYEYAIFDRSTKRQMSRARETVTAVTDAEVIYNDGQSTRDLLGNEIETKDGDGTRLVHSQFYAAEYTLGKKWASRHTVVRRTGFTDEMQVDFLVVAREEIEVPAGRFDAFRVEGSGNAAQAKFRLRRRRRGQREFEYWIAPHRVRRPVAFDRVDWYIHPGQHGFDSKERWELAAFFEASR